MPGVERLRSRHDRSKREPAAPLASAETCSADSTSRSGATPTATIRPRRPATARPRSSERMSTPTDSDKVAHRPRSRQTRFDGIERFRVGHCVAVQRRGDAMDDDSLPDYQGRDLPGSAPRRNRRLCPGHDERQQHEGPAGVTEPPRPKGRWH